MSTPQSTPLRLPTSLKAEVVRRAKADGTSFNQFVATAVAEKLAAMNTATFFAERRARADFNAFDAIMRRRRGEPQGELTGAALIAAAQASPYRDIELEPARVSSPGASDGKGGVTDDQR